MVKVVIFYIFFFHATLIILHQIDTMYSFTKDLLTFMETLQRVLKAVFRTCSAMDRILVL